MTIEATAAAFDAARAPGLALFLFEDVGALRPIDFGQRFLGEVPHGWNLLAPDYASSDTPPAVTLELVPTGQLTSDDLPYVEAVMVTDDLNRPGIVYMADPTVDGDVWRFVSSAAAGMYRPTVTSGPERTTIGTYTPLAGATPTFQPGDAMGPLGLTYA